MAEIIKSNKYCIFLNNDKNISIHIYSDLKTYLRDIVKFFVEDGRCYYRDEINKDIMSHCFENADVIFDPDFKRISINGTVRSYQIRHRNHRIVSPQQSDDYQPGFDQEIYYSDKIPVVKNYITNVWLEENAVKEYKKKWIFFTDVNKFDYCSKHPLVIPTILVKKVFIRHFNIQKEMRIIEHGELQFIR